VLSHRSSYLSWFSSRAPRRLISAYSTFKKPPLHLLDWIGVYIPAHERKP